MFKILLFLVVSLIACLLVYKILQKPKKIIKIEKGDYQVVVVVNKDLEMSKGKILSQFGHAIDALHEKLVQFPELVNAWRNSGSAKIAVKGTQADLNRICNECKEKGIIYAKIHDAGRTQVKAGSNTVVVVGPATKKQLTYITGQLQLY